MTIEHSQMQINFIRQLLVVTLQGNNKFNLILIRFQSKGYKLIRQKKSNLI